MPKLLAEHRSGDKLEATLLVHESELKTARTGSLYISMTLGDKSGSISTKMWSVTREVFETFGVDDLVAVRGHVQDFKGEMQLIVESIIWQDPATVDMATLLPCTENDVDEMMAEIEGFVAEIEQPKLCELVTALLTDERLRRGYMTAPAAVRYHHAYLGGLLEHSLGVARLARAVIEQYPHLDGDLLMAGAILHDIGKIDEFIYDRSFRYSDVGGLLGHTVIGTGMIEDIARTIDEFPSEKLHVLRHLILSHHGEHAYGAPVLPCTAEALALHHVDNLDAKINAFGRLTSEDPDSENRWTGWSRMFERRLYKGPDNNNSDD